MDKGNTNSNHWKRVYNRGALSPAVSRARGQACWERLRDEVAIGDDWTGLDFGCGHGHLVQNMSLSLRLVLGIDVSPNLLRISRKNTAGLSNVIIKQCNSPPDNFHQPCFDLIVANSTSEYMSDRELGQWMKWWIGSLSARGKLIISDVIPKKNNRLLSFLVTLKWAREQRCLLGVLYEHLLMVRSGYFYEKPYCRDPEELFLQISNCGGQNPAILRNLDFLSTRYAVISEKRPD